MSASSTFGPILQRQVLGTSFGPSVALDVLRELAGRADHIRDVSDIDLTVGIFDTVEAARPSAGLGYDTLMSTQFVGCLMFDDYSALIAIREGDEPNSKLRILPEPLHVARTVVDDAGREITLEDRRADLHSVDNFSLQQKAPSRDVQSFRYLLDRSGHRMEAYTERLAADIREIGDELAQAYGFGKIHTMPDALKVAVPSGDREAMRDLQELLTDARDYAARAGSDAPFSLVVHGFDGLSDLRAATVSQVEIAAAIDDTVWLKDRMGAAAAELLSTEQAISIIRLALRPEVDAGVMRAMVARRKQDAPAGSVSLDSVWPTSPDRIHELMEKYGLDDPHPSAEPQPLAAGA